MTRIRRLYSDLTVSGVGRLEDWRTGETWDVMDSKHAAVVIKLLLSDKRDAGNAMLNTEIKTYSNNLSTCNAPIGVTLLW